MGVVERVSAVIFHVFATVLVFKGVIRKQARYYLLALMYHTVFNFGALMLMQATNMYVGEVALLVLAIGMAYYVIRQKKIMTPQIETPQEETPQEETPQNETPQDD